MIYQIWVSNNYFNLAVGGIRSTTWSWKTMPKILCFEGWRINPKTRSARPYKTIKTKNGIKYEFSGRSFKLKRTRI